MNSTLESGSSAANTSVHWSKLPVRNGSKITKGALVAVSVGIGLVGMAASIGGALTSPVTAGLMGSAHLVDRVKNGVEANDELKYRAEFYSAQIFKQLGIKADKNRKATVSEFKQAASSNAELAKIYKAPIKKKNDANRESLMTNGGIAAASAVIPGGGVVAGVAEATKTGLEIGHAAKMAMGAVNAAKSLLPTMAAAMGGGALARAIGGKTVDPQELIEAMQVTIADAQAKGIKTSDVIEPNMVFLLRVSQDEHLAETIKRTFGHGKKAFHQMNDDEQTQVMLAYPALANAATSEAYAVANNMFQVQELGTSKPNLNSMANQYAVGTRNSSFASRVQAQRAAAAVSQNGAITA